VPLSAYRLGRFAAVCRPSPGGARNTVTELALQNLEAFEKYDLDTIVTGCASCGSNLKENYGELLRETGVEEERIEKFLSMILDINEYLYRHSPEIPDVEGKRVSGGSGPRLKVTFHHPCHLGRLQGVKDEPIALIQSIPDITYVPMVDGDRCCGMGGSFSLENYDISREINDQKIARIIETGADAVVTSCPACIMHLQDGLNRNRRGDIEVIHITDLLVRYDSERQDPVPSTQEAGEDRKAEEQSKVQQAGPHS
jgi:glycolate oxidase iron-sulfur subunit